jgi:DDE superfamily endonuclease
MELTASFVDLLQQFAPVFTVPTYRTFVAIIAGWVLSQRHRFITEVIFSSDNVGNGHWSRFHRFFSHAAWDIDTFSLALTKLVLTILAPGALLIVTVDDTLCRKRGLTLYGVGMHYDPLISSRSKKLVSWGHDWVVLCVLIVHPFWAPTKVFALPIAARLYINRQGLTKGKKSRRKSTKCKAAPKTKSKAAPKTKSKAAPKTKSKAAPKTKSKAAPKTKSKATPKAKTNSDHRTRPELALELIHLVARWLSDHEILVLGDSAYGGRSVLSHLPANVHLISRVHPKAALYQPAPPKAPRTKGRPRKKGDRLPGMTEWADDSNQPWTQLDFDQFGLHAALEVKTMQALYYKSGGDRLLKIVLVRDREGKRPDQMFYSTKREWTASEILSAYAHRWATECTFEYCKQFLGLEDPANRLPKAVERTAPMAMFIYSLVVVWFHRTGHAFVRFPFRPWYPKKAEPSFADMLTTLRRLSYEEKTAGLLANPLSLKTWLAQLTELLSRTG